MTAPVCSNCRWVDIRVDLDSGSCYWCTRKDQRIEGDFLFKSACEHFKPADGTGARPKSHGRRGTRLR